MRFQGIFAFALLAHHGSSAVFDLGDVSQYKPQLAIPPTLTGSAVWLSGDESDGFDFILSADSGAKARGVLEACGVLDNQCFQDVQQVLTQSDLQIDPQLNKRDFFALLSKTFKLASYRTAVITAILMAMWEAKFNDGQLAGGFIPHPIAEAVGAFSTPGSEVVIEVQGSPLVTAIALAPSSATLVGPSQPSVTAVAIADNGLEIGDLVACMDAGLASRIDEVMHRTVECKDGREFDAAQGPSRVGDTYGSTICGAEAVIAMAQPGGAFNDLLLINPTSITFSFAAAAGPVARASRVLADFVLAYAPTLNIAPEAAEMMANYVFAVAITTLIDNIPLAAENPIKTKFIDDTPGSCPDIEKEPLFCGFVDDSNCDMVLPKSLREYATCKSGEYEGCSCIGSSDPYEHIVSAEEIADILHLAELMKASQPGPSTPACDNKKLSVLPASVFSSSSNNVYQHFCESWSPSAGDMHMVVDSAGKNTVPGPHTRLGGRGHFFEARAPPSDPSIWSQYRFSLGFKATQDGGPCSADCAAAFEQTGTACRQQGGNDPKLASRGSLDVGCGIFSFEVFEPTSTTARGERECFPHEENHTHGVVTEHDVSGTAFRACLTALGVLPVTGPVFSISADDPPRTSLINAGGTGYFHSISWDEGCVLDNGQTSQLINQPRVPNDGGTSECVLVLVDNWKLCDNGAAGGRIRVGCVVYEFKPTSPI